MALILGGDEVRGLFHVGIIKAVGISTCPTV